MMPDDLPNEEALNEQPKEQHQENEDEEDYDDLEIVLENSTKAVEPARYLKMVVMKRTYFKAWHTQHSHDVFVKG